MLPVDTVYFHIGSIKTGSTAIQKFCFENRAALLAAGIDYAQFQTPQLHLPRWANADCFLRPEIDTDFVRAKISESSARSIVISEEGLMGRPSVFGHPVFSSMRRVIILYLRNSVELVASWAGENSLPYNFWQIEHSSGHGIVSIDEGIGRWSNEYNLMLMGLHRELRDDPGIEVRIRPFPVMGGKNLLVDFLQQLDFSEDAAEHLLGTTEDEMVNEGSSRKYCDTAYHLSQLALKHDAGQVFSNQFVNTVHSQLRSGDSRRVVNTLSEEQKLFIRDRLSSTVRILMDHYGQIENIESIPSQPSDQIGPYVRIDHQELTQLFLETLAKEYQITS